MGNTGCLATPTCLAPPHLVLPHQPVSTFSSSSYQQQSKRVYCCYHPYDRTNAEPTLISDCTACSHRQLGRRDRFSAQRVPWTSHISGEAICAKHTVGQLRRLRTLLRGRPFSLYKCLPRRTRFKTRPTPPGGLARVPALYPSNTTPLPRTPPPPQGLQKPPTQGYRHL